MIPARLTSPTVGLMPTTPLADAGQTIEPSVSVPTATAPKLADTAAAEPELEPQGLRSSTNGLRHWPPRALQPLDERLERMLAHSLMFALASRTAPAARSRSATCESWVAIEPSSASEPAVVVIRSAVSMLSLRSTGMPWSGPRGPFAARSSSSCLGQLERVRVGLDDGLERRAGPVHRGDAGEILLHDAPRRVATRGHARLQLGDGDLLELERRRRRR